MRINVEDAILVLIRKGLITKEMIDILFDVDGAITQEAHDYYVKHIPKEEDKQ